MKISKSVLAVLVLAAFGSYAAAGELDAVRAQSGVKFNETLVGRSAAGINSDNSFLVSPPAPVAETAPAAQAAPKAAAPALSAPAAAPSSRAVTAPSRVSRHHELCYDSVHGYYYECHDYHNDEHTPWNPTVTTSITSALLVGALLGWALSPLIGIIAGVVILAVGLSIALGKKKEK